MTTLNKLIDQIKTELSDEFSQRLRKILMNQDKEWLVEQIISLTLSRDKQLVCGIHPPTTQKLALALEDKERKHRARLERISKIQLDEDKLAQIIKRYKRLDREQLEAQGYLNNPPQKGTALITNTERSSKGNELLLEAKDVFYALLFGDKDTNVRFDRVERELLTLIVPEHKFHVIDFMVAVTQIGGEGTWKDPNNVSHDDREKNIILQTEYGEVESELISEGLLATVKIINNLEINEQVLYFRMIDVEQSSLVA
ncbi:MAG: hypothetical protein F6K26_14395 [Moorea sp. SIO2I5]|nr:hypothetical protein [Moorena sp. SIO2I5]